MNKILLNNVTLVSVTSIDLPETQLAMMISMHDIDFAAVKLITSENIAPQSNLIEIVNIPKIDKYAYSIFVLHYLYDFIQTDFCLLIQADGFVLNANRWQNEFLNYDYIGAPWPKDFEMNLGEQTLKLSKNQVGNGGFSLRSKKLLKETRAINLPKILEKQNINQEIPTISEDLIICHYFYEELIKKGIRFPKPEIAAQFSIESETALYGQTPKTSFGFHGKQLRDQIFSSILSSQVYR